MKNKIITIALSFILASNSNLALAKNTDDSSTVSPYFRIDSGWSKFRDTSVPVTISQYFNQFSYKKVSSDFKPTLGAGIGLNLNRNLRTDFIFMRHISTAFKSSKTHTIKRVPLIDTYFLNLYYDIPNIFKGFTPYVGTGIGVALIKDKVKSFIHTKATMPRKTNLAYKFVIGSSVDLNEKVKMDISYTYHNYGKSSSNIINNQEFGKAIYKGYIISAGIRFGL